jgi:hypothetical protein
MYRQMDRTWALNCWLGEQYSSELPITRRYAAS